MSFLDEGIELNCVEEGGYKLDTPNSDRAKQQAAEENLDVVFAGPNSLLIDLDTEEDYKLFKKQHRVYEKYIGPAPWVEGWSKSGPPKRHVTVTLAHKITNTERILLQALLGSDRVRELLSWIQELNGDPNPTLFLEKRDPFLLDNPALGVVEVIP